MEHLKIALNDIRLATENFSEKCVIGSGGFGRVYKAELEVLDIHRLSSMEGKSKDELPKIRKTVAIKRVFSRKDEEDKQLFLTEVELLASLKHPNIISLAGLCIEEGETILVYEYATKGSLADHLSSNFRATNFTWGQRLQICLDIAYGINYLHTDMEGKPAILHRDIKSDNILLDENLKAKLADFGFSKLVNPMISQITTVYTRNIAGTELYLDPEYTTTGRLSKKSDIYSFGVVLFEILSGSLAYDRIYMDENEKGLASIARRCYIDRKLKQLIDPKIAEEDDHDHIFTLNRAPNQDSFNTFAEIAFHCLEDNKDNRPTMEVVVQELEKALKLQGETLVLSIFQLSDILLATENFAGTYCIGSDANSIVYKAELNHFGNSTTVAIKRIINRKHTQGKQEFIAELETGTTYKHPNIVSLLGFCDESDENILVYEHASHRSLDDYLKSIDHVKMNTFTWTQCLHMCLEIAHGLNHLHTKMLRPHSDIKSANILLYKNWEAKISYFGISKLHETNQDISAKVYEDPAYEMSGKLNKESDIYSFGIVLFEIFCGRVAYDPVFIKENDKGLAPVACHCFNDGAMERLMDPKLKEESGEDISTSKRRTNQDSIDTFLEIAYQCVGEVVKSRPTMEMVIKELERALNFKEPQDTLEYI